LDKEKQVRHKSPARESGNLKIFKQISEFNRLATGSHANLSIPKQRRIVDAYENQSLASVQNAQDITTHLFVPKPAELI
jgi:hypothetical protein